MLTEKRRIMRILEKYINEGERKNLELFYGINSRLKIRDYGFSTNMNCYFFDVIILLGESVNEDYMEDIFANELISESLKVLFSEDKKVSIIVKFDV